MNPLLDYTLRLADNSLILGHRLSEWCGHGPILEQDIAMTNLALDLIGQSRSLYQYAAEIEGQGRSEDDLAYLRDGWDFRNVQLTELPNGDFGRTVMRQFLYDAYEQPFLEALSQSRDERLAAIAAKSLKEATYHLRWSSEWVIRLGDGTEESHRRVQTALNELWPYCGELTRPNATDITLLTEGIAPDLDIVAAAWQKKITEVLEEATLRQPETRPARKGGKDGVHTEHLGYILAEMQFLQRTYPGAQW
ncbi:MAG: phenylacetate-CoA oxygenase subunit PaaI [Bacteroidetes bacterium]|nr:MAG: phenylacetate-CoA oxygenase subunit PaaI [Bacteroidota bacterium]